MNNTAFLSDHPGPPPQRNGTVEFQFPEPPRCECPNPRLVRRTRSNGTVVVVRQCPRCGCEKGAVKKTEIQDINLIPPWNQLTADRWRDQNKTYWDERQDAQKRALSQSNEAWWDWYNRYLKCAAWHRRRRAALDRDNGICQGCRIRKATQVHHLTYDRVGYEMLFDLTAVCDTCHEQIHAGGEG